MSETLFAAILHDLKALLSEEREKCPTLFSSKEMADRFGSVPISCPPRPHPKAAPPQSMRKFEGPPEVQTAQLKKASPAKEVDKLEGQIETQETLPSSFFVLEPAPLLASSSLRDKPLMEKRIQKLFPKWKLLERPSSDRQATLLASSWKIRKAEAEILILLFSLKTLERTFLQNLAAAIEREIAPAQLIDARSIEQEKMWDTLLSVKELKAIYAPPLETWNTPHLLHYVKRIPSSGKSFLGSCPLYFLDHPGVYLNSPSQKRLLWQQICKNHL